MNTSRQPIRMSTSRPPVLAPLALLALASLVALGGCGGLNDDPILADDGAQAGNGSTSGTGTDVGTGTGTGAGTDVGGDTDGGAGAPGTDAGTDLSSGSAITVDNHGSVLREVVAATNLTALRADAERVDALASALLAEAASDGLGARGLTFVSDEPFADGVRERYGCDAGGAMVLSVYREDRPGRYVDLEFDDCALGADRYDGGYSTSSFNFERRDDAFEAFTATFADGSGFSIDGDRRITESRGFDIASDAWTDTDYVHRDAGGAESIQSGLDLAADILVARGFDGPEGYVTLADGSSAYVVPQRERGSVTASYELTDPSIAAGPLGVTSTLAFDGDHYRFVDEDPDGRGDVVVPGFPVSDLGSPLVLEGAGGAADVSIEPSAEVPAGAEQWNAGTLSVTADDGSQVVMSPSADDPSMVEIRVDGSDEPILRDWSDGFQVRCPASFGGCS